MKEVDCPYLNISSAIRPVPHTEDLPVPVPPQYILDSDEEPNKNREKHAAKVVLLNTTSKRFCFDGDKNLISFTRY
jgi:hypothetical protein